MVAGFVVSCVPIWWWFGIVGGVAVGWFSPDPMAVAWI